MNQFNGNYLTAEMVKAFLNSSDLSKEVQAVSEIEKNGGQGRNRTADAGLFRAALYQLSYLAIAFEEFAV
jgi:hypothetical protein